MVQINQDLTSVTEEDMAPTEGGDFKAWPKDTYRVMVTDSDYITTKDGLGKFLKLTITCLDGPLKGRLHWENLNLENKNSQTVQISRVQLRSLATAMGHPMPELIGDSDELHNKPFRIRMYQKKASAGYGDSDGMENAIGEYLLPSPAPADDESPPKPAQEQDLLVGDDDTPF